MKDFIAVAASGGKDSTALLLLMMERGLPIDGVFYADTGMEFPEMQAHMQKLDESLYQERGIHITTLRHPHGFEWMMFEEPKVIQSSIENRQRLGIPAYGNGWPGPRVRWCTGQLKTKLVDKHLKQLTNGERNVIQYVGIASDESRRCKDNVHKRYPLVEWGITEAQALQICYDRGFDWGGLYKIYHRCSCWCCPLQRIDNLRKLRQHHPDLWRRLLDMDRRAREQFGYTPLGRFKERWSVEQLDQRFADEEKQTLIFRKRGGTMNVRINAGYIITDSVHIGTMEFVLGVHSTAPNQFVTWACKNGNEYFWGHYFSDLPSATKDLIDRASLELEYCMESKSRAREQTLHKEQEDMCL